MKILRIMAVAFGAIVAGTMVTLTIINPRNYAKTSENADDSNLLTRRYNVPRREFDGDSKNSGVKVFLKEVEFILSRQTTYGRNWKIVESKVNDDSALVKAEVPVVFFIDELEVQMQFIPSNNFDTSRIDVILNVSSASRVGKSDLGENRRHIEQLLQEFDFAFGNDKF